MWVRSWLNVSGPHLDVCLCYPSQYLRFWNSRGLLNHWNSAFISCTWFDA
jgi:hypothetical protein